MTYGAFVAGLKKADIALDRKTLADVAVRDAGTFTRIVEAVRGA
jgi:large subunit ribosomal protein L20